MSKPADYLKPITTALKTAASVAVKPSRKRDAFVGVVLALAAVSTNINSALVQRERQVAQSTQRGASMFAELAAAAAPDGRLVKLDSAPVRNDQSLRADAKPDGAQPA